MTFETDQAYSGVDNLEVMLEAQRYNAFLSRLIAESGGMPPPQRILDFGAGTGMFADECAAKLARPSCVEPDKRLRESLSKRGYETYPDIDAVPPASKDYIYSLNVLEHIDDDCAAAKGLLRALRPGGSLMIYVPAFECLYSVMDEKVGHRRRYTKAGLRRLLSSAGFSVQRIGYADSLGFFAALAYKAFGSRDGSINKQALILYDRFAFPFSRALDLLLGSFIGKNLFAVAIKPAEGGQDSIRPPTSAASE